MVTDNKRELKQILLVLFLFLCGLSWVYSYTSSELLNYEGNATKLYYDRENSTFAGVIEYSYGSNSYMDNSPTNPDVFLRICHDNLSTGKMVDLVYYTENYNITESVLAVNPLVTSTWTPVSNGTGLNYKCADVNVDLSSRKAIYPGYLLPLVDDNFLTPLNLELNGSYDIGVRVDAPPKTYYLSTQRIFDHNNERIYHREPYLLSTFVNATNGTEKQERLAPGETMSYEGQLTGGEKYYVNGIMSIEFKIFEPCGVINESGYYIMNSSQYDLNTSCVVIENITNAVLNFASEVLDGDPNADWDPINETNIRNTRNCPITIKNSVNVSLEALRTQEFPYGMCIFNSSVDVIGTSTSHHTRGALISNKSTVRFVDISFAENNDTDITANERSLVSLIAVNFSSAKISSDFEDSTVKSVLNPPPKPNITGIKDIEQYIEYRKGANHSWAQISFHYPDPIPNHVVADNISIFKYNGTYITNITSFYDNVTNTTNVTYNQSWEGGEWKKLFTLVSPSERLIIGPNLSDYSVFAPFGGETDPEPEPEPTPVPSPSPSPSAGSSSGSGGQPAPVEEDETVPIFPEPILLNLTIPDNITLMQGEAGEIFFNLSNYGNITANNVTVGVEKPQGWDATNYSLESLAPGQNISESFQIAPWERAVPKEYRVPVTVIVEDEYEIVSKTLRVFVIPRTNLSRIRIREYPPVIEMEPNDVMPVSIFIENIGDVDLRNITIQYDYSECITSINGTHDVLSGESKLVDYIFASGPSGVCDYNLRFMANEKMVGFAPVTFIIRKKISPFRDWRFYVLLLVLSAWTLVTFFVLRRRRGKKEEPKSWLFKNE